MNTAFASSDLVREILRDADVCDAVEKFLTTIPSDFCGGLDVINKFSSEKYDKTADRYMAVGMFLASYWTIPVQFEIRSRDEAAKLLNTTKLLLIGPPSFIKKRK